jgi:hypothetical protein
MNEDKSEFLKGTLDMLILKVVALGPIHGYAIAQRIQQISRDFFQLQQGSQTQHEVETLCASTNVSSAEGLRKNISKPSCASIWTGK